MKFSPRRVTLLAVASACAMVIVGVAATPSNAARVCELPATFSLTAEERGLLGTTGAGLVIVGSPARASGLQAGDVIRQANGRRTIACADLEEIAAEALAKGLLLLIAAERDGRPVAGAFGQAGAAAAVAEAPAPPARPESRAESVPAPEERAPARPAVPTAVPTPVAAREATLPPRADASAGLAAKAVAAAAVLGTIDEAARFAVPLQAYERRLGEAKDAIAALRIEGEGSAAVRDAIAEAVGYHETARDIRRYKAAELTDARVDQRGAGQSLAYFSDSEVPRWIARYPFLSETLQQAPRTTHMLLPGEMPGRWSPDQAVEMLWERAAQAAARLGAWGGAK